MPRRHSTIEHDLFNCLCPTRNFLVFRQRKRGDVAFAVAFDATFLQQRGDVIRISHRAVRLRREDTADKAAFGFRDRLGDFLPGEQFVDGFPQIASCRLVADDANAVLVVNAAPITDDAILIENEHFRRAHGVHFVGDFVAQIFKNGEIDLVNARIRRNLGDRIVRVGVDADKRDALRLIFGIELDQSRTVQFRKRALGAEKRDDDDLASGKIAQRMRFAPIVVQGEIGDDLTDGVLFDVGFRGERGKRKCRSNDGENDSSHESNSRDTISEESVFRNHDHCIIIHTRTNEERIPKMPAAVGAWPSGTHL